MIRHTFSILNGIGERFEHRLWRSGILTWDDFCRCKEILGIPTLKKLLYNSQLNILSDELNNRNSEFLASNIKKADHWRLFEEFKGDAVCLDIETNGLHYKYGGYITMVGLYNGFEWRYLIRGENLTSRNLSKELKGYKYLITFYGLVFDVPFLLNYFSDIRLNIPHFDLCMAARKLGINGGMKKIEDLFGIPRDLSVQGFNGYDAVKLWRLYQNGNLEARYLLMRYNMQDTVNLFRLAEIFYKMLRDRSGIDNYIGAKSVCGIN